MKLYACLLALPLFAAPPGAVLPGMTRNQVCADKFSKISRNEHRVSSSLRKRVLVRDGYSAKAKGLIIDHVIPVELGGSNSIDNLQARTKEDAHLKDTIENKLHRLVCSPENPLPLQQAQKAIAADWVAAYQQYLTNTRWAER